MTQEEFLGMIATVILILGFIIYKKSKAKRAAPTRSQTSVATSSTNRHSLDYKPYTPSAVLSKPIVVEPVKTVEPEERTMKIPSEIDGVPLAYWYERVDVAIISDNKPNFNLIELGAKVTLVQEPKNQYDSKAIAVHSQGIKLGYLYKGKMQDMCNDFLRRGDLIVACISSIRKTEGTTTIFLSFYKKKDAKPNVGKSRSFKLTGNTNAEMQGNIGFISEGEEVEYDYDYEKEKFSASCIYDIGYFPKSANSLLENNPRAEVESITLNDSDKLVVQVSITPKE